MRCSYFFSQILIFITITISSCGQQKNDTQAKQAGTKTSGSSKFVEGKDYQIFERVRVLDKRGFDQPAEAFSLLLPKGWQHQSEIFWTGPGSGCDGTNMQFSASSADGKYRLKIYPANTVSWSEDPMWQQMQQSMPQQTGFCGIGQPMQAEQYLKNVFAAQDLNNAQIVSIKKNDAVSNEMLANAEKARAELMSYGAGELRFHPSAVQADVKWPNGDEGIALCGTMIIENNMPNMYNGTYTRIFTTQYSYRISFQFPKEDKEAAKGMFTSMLTSIHTNPWWKDQVDKYWKAVRQKKQQVHIGKIRMMDEQTRQIGERAIKQGNERLAALDRNIRSWENKANSSSDRMHTNFVNAIREVEHYKDESGKVELSAGYNHAWSRNDGTSFILSNSPNFDPSSVFQDQSWKEMKKIN